MIGFVSICASTQADIPLESSSSQPITAASPVVPSASLNELLECSAGGYPFGIDISQWQTDLMSQLKDPGFSFIICKATEGGKWIDPKFKTNWRAIKHRGLVRGAYHFYQADTDPIIQAQHYLHTLNSWRFYWHNGKPSSTLPPILDIEDRGVSKNVDLSKLQADLLAFLNYLETKTHRKPIIYTSNWFANTYLNNPKFAQYPLWIAHYTLDAQPAIPTAWQGKAAKFWQKSNRYQLRGQNTDFDIFLGRKDELQSGLVPLLP